MTRGPLKTESRFRSSLIYLAVGICLAHTGLGWAGTPASPGKTLSPSAIRSYALPLSFEANQGQVDEQVKYLARGQGYTLFLTPGAAVLGLRSPSAGNPTEWLRLVLHGATQNPLIRGEEALSCRSNYFVGSDRTEWRTNIPNFARIRYEQVYPGVDLVYYGRQGRLENDFELNAGIDPSVISLGLEGADRIRVDSTGDLVLAVAGNEVRLQQPRAYQVDGEKQREIPIRYQVHGRSASFVVGEYDRHQKLVIDPVLTYSTYLGGTGGDEAFSVAVDSEGDAYVTGVTASINFPTTSSAYQPTYQGGSGTIFVTEFNPSGSGLIFSTYLGGTGIDIPAQILLDPTDDIYLVGNTTSNNFPITAGVLQPLYGGDQDAFLTKMKSDGTALLYSTYIGGTGIDYGTAVALDVSGDAYVTGSTQSIDFPTLNPIQLGNAGLYDSFVTEVSPKGTLLYSTYLGGSLSDYGVGIAVDSSGDVYVSGYTYSSNFPTQNAYQSTLGGGSDLFITEFTPGSSALLFSTYLGGSSLDKLSAMVLDSSGNIYLTGGTQSANFPVTATAYQSTLQGTSNAFITKVAPGASVLVYSTFFGGSSTDQANGMALDSAGNIYITGYTQSTNFPSRDAFQNVLGLYGAETCQSNNLVNEPAQPCSDAFVAKLAPTGIPVFSSFLGGNGTDSGQGIAVDSSGAAYVVGETYSSNFPATSGAFQWLFQGSLTNSNAFLSKVSAADAPSVSLNPQQISFGNQPLQIVSTPQIITLTNEGNAALSISSITSSGDFQQTNTCGTSVSGGGGTCTIQVTYTPTSVGLETQQITINDNANGGSTQGVTVTGHGVLTGGSLTITPTKMTFAAQTVNTTSPSQSALLVNTGNQAVTITNIAATGAFGETNNCGPNFPIVPASLNVGQSCTVAVNYTPTTSGSQTGSVTVTSNAVNAATSVALTGTGSPIYSLSSNQRSSVVVVGTNSTSFTIAASGPSTFLGGISLACSSGGATCTFSPTSISVGGSSNLTVTGLTASTANPLNFTVTGTSTGQTASIGLAIFFEDYTLSATPSGTTITAGNNATYTITLTPSNGFSQTVLLSCPGASAAFPLGATCYWNPPALTPAGTTDLTVSGTLTITTEAESATAHLPPMRPPGGPPGFTRWILLLGLLTLFGAVAAGFRTTAAGRRPRLSLVIVFAAMVLLGLAVSCENYVNPINITPTVYGTPSGTYSIPITGTLGNGSGVRRTTTVNLSVLPNS
jgi:hypothetical protein